MVRRLACLLPTLLVATLAAPAMAPRSAAAAATVVFETDFESGLPPEFSAPGAGIESVQGYDGLGPEGNRFGGSFLRYALQGIVDTKLTLRNLPAHQSVDVGFLLGIIDSWDGTELFRVAVDGNVLFDHWFQLALGDSSSYIAPPGALLSRGVNLGFGNGTYFFRDRAYDLAVEPAFLGIPHSADTLEVKWFLGAVSGGAASQWQGGLDESWAIDHVKVTTHAGAVDVPSRAPALGLAAPYPNPASRAGLTVRFTLATAAPATLELFDVRGRRIAACDVGARGPGAHAVDLAPAADAAPGVAFLRLTQGGQRRAARIVLVD